MLRFRSYLLVIIATLAVTGAAFAQHGLNGKSSKTSEFGPVMRAYLGYLRNEQEVVDDRISRREISGDYYRRNSNRIRALRQTAIRLVTQSGNDYVPELEAVTGEELGILFENPPSPRSFRLNQVVGNTFRYLGATNTGEVFYVFARLDPYEQAALLEANGSQSAGNQSETVGAKGQRVGQGTTRPRKAGPR
ncbi:MAG TPA: hypothetical protein VGJ69_10040 [Pyrinomonadaceae bacterium]|jgi:hypothetical protein